MSGRGLAPVGEWTGLANRCCHLIHYLGPLDPLRSRNPGEIKPPIIEAKKIHQSSEERQAAPGEQVALHVVAITRMTARDHYTIGPMLKRLDEEQWIDPSGAEQAHEAHIWGVDPPGRGRPIWARLGAPDSDQ